MIFPSKYVCPLNSGLMLVIIKPDDRLYVYFIKSEIDAKSLSSKSTDDIIEGCADLFAYSMEKLDYSDTIIGSIMSGTAIRNLPLDDKNLISTPTFFIPSLNECILASSVPGYARIVVMRSMQTLKRLFLHH